MATKASKKRLGRGLNSLLSPTRFQELAIDEADPNEEASGRMSGRDDVVAFNGTDLKGDTRDKHINIDINNLHLGDTVGADIHSELSENRANQIARQGNADNKRVSEDMGGPDLDDLDASIEQELSENEIAIVENGQGNRENYSPNKLNVATIEESDGEKGENYKEEQPIESTAGVSVQPLSTGRGDERPATAAWSMPITKSTSASREDERSIEYSYNKKKEDEEKRVDDLKIEKGTKSDEARGEMKNAREGGPFEKTVRAGQGKAGIQVGEIALEALRRNPHQPRTHWDERQLEQLAQSIRANGLIQPVVVRRQGDGYELIAGERRLRAARMAGLEKIPAIIRVATEEEMLEWSLVENIHRADLNPMERARAYQRYVRSFSLTQHEAAERLGEDRATLANYMRLLELPERVQELTARGVLSMGHARALLTLESAKLQDYFGQMAEEYGWSVRFLENRIRLHKKNAQEGAEGGRQEKEAHIMDLEKQLSSALAMRVWIKTKGKRRQQGTVTIEFYSLDDFEKIQETLLKTEL